MYLLLLENDTLGYHHFRVMIWSFLHFVYHHVYTSIKIMNGRQGLFDEEIACHFWKVAGEMGLQK